MNRMTALLRGKQAPRNMSEAAAVAPAGAQNLANYPQSGFRTDRLGQLKQNKERTEVNAAFAEGFQPVSVALVIPWKQPGQAQSLRDP